MAELNQDKSENPEVIVEAGSSKKFLPLLKNLVVLLLLIAVIVGSFWLSFLFGKKLLAPVRKEPEQKIEVAIPEPPPSLAALQELEKVVSPAKKVEPRTAALEKNGPRKIVKGSAYLKYYKVQAGFFSRRQNALNLASKLKANNFETYVRQMTNGWRVQVGAFEKKSQAVSLQNALRAKGFDSVLIYE